jgi:hypothetical protein
MPAGTEMNCSRKPFMKHSVIDETESAAAPPSHHQSQTDRNEAETLPKWAQVTTPHEELGSYVPDDQGNFFYPEKENGAIDQIAL